MLLRLAEIEKSSLPSFCGMRSRFTLKPETFPPNETVLGSPAGTQAASTVHGWRPESSAACWYAAGGTVFQLTGWVQPTVS